MNRLDLNTPSWRTVFKQVNLFNKMILILATWFGSGRISIAPGTAGTLAALPLVFLLAQFHSWPALILTGVFLCCAVWIADRAQKLLAQDDPGLIVIDEVAGLIVSLLWVPLSFLNILSGLLLFRLFDILKPYPIKKLENLPGGFGIVLDDVLAGIYANLALRLMILVWNHLQ